MTNEFKVGVNFDDKLLDKIIELNKKYTKTNSVVSELYGSIKGHADLAARPDFRLPDKTLTDVTNYVRKAAHNNINFNYTLNSIVPYGSKYEMSKHYGYIESIINYFAGIGVYRITVANPIMLEFIRNVLGNKDIHIELSTIAHIDTITQIKYYHEEYGVDKICCNLLKNRDFDWLNKAASYCIDHNIILELMANEFCGVGGNDYGTHCIYRDSCYICHATNHSQKDADRMNGYPMNFCTQSRNRNPVNWLRMNWIRPDDIRYYNEIGIRHFKITGRTGSTEYITRTIEAYLKQQFTGNLLSLWKPLESIKNVELEDVHIVDIPSQNLNGFIENWAYNHKVCANEVCGETCTYCQDFYNECIARKE